MQLKSLIIRLVLTLLVIIDSPLFSQAPEPGNAQREKWQRNLEMGAFAAVFFAAGCGADLLARREGDAVVEQNYRDKGIGLNLHRTVHGAASVAGMSLYLVSAWQLYQVNQTREQPEFRHKAHNTLFTATVTGVTAAGILGILSANAFRNGDSGQGKDYARIMKRIGFATLSIGFADIVLFGRPDNATIFGVKINF